MPLNLGAILSAGSGIISSILRGKAQRRAQERAMALIREIMAKQEKDFQQAYGSLQQGQAEFMANPARGRYLREAEEMLNREGPFNAGAVSLMKANASDQAARTSAAQMSALREGLQRSGVRGGAALMAQQQVRAAGVREAGQRRNEITLGTRQAQEDYKRRALQQYHEIAGGDADKQYQMRENIAHLFGSKQYGNSGLFASLGGGG